MQQPGASTGEEITIGVVGADEIVRRVMSVARESGNRSWRLIAAVYTDEQDAHRQSHLGRAHLVLRSRSGRGAIRRGWPATAVPVRCDGVGAVGRGDLQLAPALRAREHVAVADRVEPVLEPALGTLERDAHQ